MPKKWTREYAGHWVSPASLGLPIPEGEHLVAGRAVGWGRGVQWFQRLQQVSSGAHCALGLPSSGWSSGSPIHSFSTRPRAPGHHEGIPSPPWLLPPSLHTPTLSVQSALNCLLVPGLCFPINRGKKGHSFPLSPTSRFWEGMQQRTLAPPTPLHLSQTGWRLLGARGAGSRLAAGPGVRPERLEAALPRAPGSVLCGCTTACSAAVGSSRRDMHTAARLHHLKLLC